MNVVVLYQTSKIKNTLIIYIHYRVKNIIITSRDLYYFTFKERATHTLLYCCLEPVLFVAYM